MTPASGGDNAEIQNAQEENGSGTETTTAEVALTPDEDHDQEIQNYDIVVQNSIINPAQWRNGLTINPKIGSVHLGQVPLVANELTLEGGEKQIFVQPDRIESSLQGGQMYNPFIKRASRTTENIRAIGALPAMVANLLLPSKIRKATKEEKDRIIELIKILKDIKTTYQEEIKVTHGNCCVRLEFFFKSDLQLQENIRTWTWPITNPYDYLIVSNQNSFFENFSKNLDDLIDPLVKTFVENKDLLCYDRVSGKAKRMLILNTEAAIDVTDFYPFYGRAMKRVNQIRRQDEREARRTMTNEEKRQDKKKHIMFHVPANLLEPLEEAEVRATLLPKGLSSRVFQLPRIAENAEITNINESYLRDDNHAYVQGYQNEASMSIELNNIFMQSIGRILSILWSKLPVEIAEQSRNLYELPDDDVLKAIPTERKQDFVEQCCRILSNCYDFEWWWRSMARLKKYCKDRKIPHKHVRRPEDFPVSEAKLNDFISQRATYVSVRQGPKRKITSLGKLVIFVSLSIENNTLILMFQNSKWNVIFVSCFYEFNRTICQTV